MGKYIRNMCLFWPKWIRLYEPKTATSTMNSNYNTISNQQQTVAESGQSEIIDIMTQPNISEG
jgi:hypothetical protein